MDTAAVAVITVDQGRTAAEWAEAEDEAVVVGMVVVAAVAAVAATAEVVCPVVVVTSG